MTSEKPAEQEKRSFEEWLVKETNTTPEEIEQGKKEAEEAVRVKRNEKEEEDK